MNNNQHFHEAVFHGGTCTGDDHIVLSPQLKEQHASRMMIGLLARNPEVVDGQVHNDLGRGRHLDDNSLSWNTRPLVAIQTKQIVSEEMFLQDLDEKFWFLIRSQCVPNVSEIAYLQSSVLYSLDSGTLVIIVQQFNISQKLTACGNVQVKKIFTHTTSFSLRILF